MNLKIKEYVLKVVKLFFNVLYLFFDGKNPV